MKILIADNDTFTREALATGINWEKLGFDTIYMAKNGPEVVSTVQMTPPDLIITELSLPYLNGLQMIEELRVRDIDTQFIIVSSQMNVNLLKSAIRLNVFDFIPKPVNLNEMEDAVARVHQKLVTERQMSGAVRTYTEPDPLLIPLGDHSEQIELCDISEIREAIAKDDFDLALQQFRKKKAYLLGLVSCPSSVYVIVAVECFNAFRRELTQHQGKLEEAIPSVKLAVQDVAAAATAEEALAKLDAYLSELTEYAKMIFGKTINSDIEKAKEYIDQNFSNIKISLNEVARRINMNPAYFSVLFKKDIGMTFINYLTDVRLSKAGEMLGKTNMKIYEIAYAVGYDNPTYFSTVFKKNTGLSPQDYRRIHS